MASERSMGMEEDAEEEEKAEEDVVAVVTEVCRAAIVPEIRHH